MYKKYYAQICKNTKYMYNYIIMNIFYHICMQEKKQ